MTRSIVLQAEELDASAAAWLGERCDLFACRAEHADRFDELLAKAHGLIVRTYTQVGPSLLQRAPNLRVVGRAGVGLDRVDIAACRARGVEVVHTPDANGQAVAEFVFALLHDALRPRLFLDRAVDLQRWTQLRAELCAPNQLSELVLGVWGLGRIGTRVARAATGLGMDVIYNDLREIPEADRAGARPVSRGELLASADILTLHTDPRPANRHLLGAQALARCKPTAIIINTSRGMMACPHALADFLRANPAAKALLDVHEPEPFDGSCPLLGLPNAHLTPHIAAATATAHANMSWVVRDVWRVLSGQTPEHPAPPVTG
jgi:phosphoglycerate dehydrogenase-like enzyme